MLAYFQHNPARFPRVLKGVGEMRGFSRPGARVFPVRPRGGLLQPLATAEIAGDRLTEEEVVANAIVTMVGGQETTTNLIGNGVVSLLRNPAQMARLKEDASIVPSAVEELLRYESPSQHTARLAPKDTELG